MKEYNYIVKVFSHNGKKYKVYGKTEEDAILKREEARRRLLDGEVKKNTVTVEEWAYTALNAFKRNVSPDYMEQMTSRIKKHILDDIGNKRIQDVTLLDCQRILNRQEGRSVSHIAKLKQELDFIFETARKNGLIRANPAADVETPPGTKGTRRALTPNERGHFLKVSAGNPQYMIFRLMLFCGLRPSEARELRHEDITTIQGIKFFHVRGTKSNAADRLVPIPSIILDALPPGAGYICRTKTGSRFDKSAYRRAADHLRRDLNISMGCKVYRNQLVPPLPLAPDFVPYFLRHTYCTDLKKKGVDLRLAKELMGHADIKITASIYDHADNESAVLAAIQMGLGDKTGDNSI